MCLTIAIAVPGWFLSVWHFAIIPPSSHLLHSPILAANQPRNPQHPLQDALEGTGGLVLPRALGASRDRTPDVPERVQGSKPNTRTSRAGHLLLQAALSPSERSLPKWFAQHFPPSWSFCSNQASSASLGTAFSWQCIPLVPLPTAARRSWAQLQAAKCSPGAKHFSRASQELLP